MLSLSLSGTGSVPDVGELRETPVRADTSCRAASRSSVNTYRTVNNLPLHVGRKDKV